MGDHPPAPDFKAAEKREERRRLRLEQQAIGAWVVERDGKAIPVAELELVRDGIRRGIEHALPNEIDVRQLYGENFNIFYAEMSEAKAKARSINPPPEPPLYQGAPDMFDMPWAWLFLGAAVAVLACILVLLWRGVI